MFFSFLPSLGCLDVFFSSLRCLSVYLNSLNSDEVSLFFKALCPGADLDNLHWGMYLQDWWMCVGSAIFSWLFILFAFL